MFYENRKLTSIYYSHELHQLLSCYLLVFDVCLVIHIIVYDSFARSRTQHHTIQILNTSCDSVHGVAEFLNRLLRCFSFIAVIERIIILFFILSEHTKYFLLNLINFKWTLNDIVKAAIKASRENLLSD